MTGQALRAAVITVSDSRSAGGLADLSGPAVAEVLKESGIAVVSQTIVPDQQEEIEEALRRYCDEVPFVVTTGGTGLAPRDVTPEATRNVCDRILDGLAEVMRAEGRKETAFAALARGIAGSRGSCLILNLPGSPRGAVTSLRAVLPLIPHALALLQGGPVSHESPEAGATMNSESGDSEAGSSPSSDGAAGDGVQPLRKAGAS